MRAPACYHDEKQLIDAFFEAFEDSNHTIDMKEVLEITYNPATVRFRFRLLVKNVYLEVLLAPALSEMFGLQPSSKFHTFAHLRLWHRDGNFDTANDNYCKTMINTSLDTKLNHCLGIFSSRRTDLKNGVWNIYVYTNLIDAHYVGEEMVSVLGIFPLRGNVGNYISEEPINSPWFKVRVRELRDVEIVLADFRGQRIKFLDGSDPVYLRLHFRKVKTSSVYRG